MPEADFLPGMDRVFLQGQPAARCVLPRPRGSAPGPTAPRTRVMTHRFEDIGHYV